ncbi:MAG: hypothetical protein Q8P93_02550 [bacterium]|nr:hypothetical protein [bacterium]
MPNRIALKQGHYYHLRNFGADGRLLFRVTADRERFLQLLYLCNSQTSVVVRDVRNKRDLFSRERVKPLTAIGAFSILPDSFDLVVYEHTQGGTSRFMQKLATGYSMYFNHQYGRTGRIFAGSYRARELTDGNDVLSAIAGVHLAPLSRIEPHWQEDGLSDLDTAQRHLAHYHYSSYVDYHNQVDRKESHIIDLVAFDQAHTILSPEAFMSHMGIWFGGE